MRRPQGAPCVPEHIRGLAHEIAGAAPRGERAGEWETLRCTTEADPAAQIATILRSIEELSIAPIARLAYLTGLRRGELAALRWSDIDFNRATLRVARSLEQTRAGLRFKSPKTAHGRRIVALPPSGVTLLRKLKKDRLELRAQLGQGRLPDDALVFCRLDGSPRSPDIIGRDWRDALETRKLPRVTFHALRHAHASALIAAGLDVVTVSRRLGHGSAAITLRVYGHLFSNTDAAAAAAIEAALSSA